MTHCHLFTHKLNNMYTSAETGLPKRKQSCTLRGCWTTNNIHNNRAADMVTKTNVKCWSS